MMSKVKIIVGIILLLILYTAFVISYSSYTFPKEKIGIQNTVDSFFRYSSENKVDEAYNLTTSSFKSNTSKSEFTKILNNRDIFENVVDSEASSFRFGSSFTNPLHPEFSFEGNLLYKNGNKRPLQGKLIKEDGQWKFDSFFISTSL